MRHKVQRAARRAVRDIAGVEAVLLFGSRARHEARPESDWDLAVITKAGAKKVKEVQAAFMPLANVAPLVLTPGSIRKHCNSAVRIESAVARDGIVLAGEWERPHYREGRLRVTNTELIHMLSLIKARIRTAMFTCCAHAGPEESYAPELVEYSQMAAEEVSKAVIASFGAKARSVHNLEALGNQLHELAYSGTDDDMRRHGFAQQITMMNGTRHLHHAGYYRHKVEKPGRTKERIGQAMELHAAWLEWYTKRSTRAQQAAALAYDDVGTMGKEIEGHPRFKEIRPESLQGEFRHWAQSMDRIRQECMQGSNKDG